MHIRNKSNLDYTVNGGKRISNSSVIHEDSQESKDEAVLTTEEKPASNRKSEKHRQSVNIEFAACKNRRTLFTEFETIEIAIQIIDLLDVLHSKQIIHTNLNPNNIFLVEGKITQMCFLSLYHCSWQTAETLKNSHIGEDFEDNISQFDTRTRQKSYVSPEQIVIGNELAEIVY